MNAHTLRAQQTVDRISSAWLGAPQITVVQAPADLPIPTPSDVRGMYRRGDVWVVADTQPASRVAQTLAHEAIGHAAMRDTLGGSWRPFMHAVQDGIRSGDLRLGYIRQGVRCTYTDETGACNLSTVQVSDEIAASLVEMRFDSSAGRLEIGQPGRKMALAAIGHVSREVLYLNRPAGMAELEGMLLAAEHRLRRGGWTWIGFWLGRWYASAMAKPWNPSSPPMSLRESQNLLKAETDRIKDNEEWKVVGMVWWAVLAVIGFLVAAFFTLVDLFGFLAR